MAYIQSLQLTNFRSYTSAQLSGMSTQPVVLYGANGAGKTNILEAISFLSPGRGIRSAKLPDIQHNHNDFDGVGAAGFSPSQPWAVSALAETLYGETRLGTGATQDLKKRLIRINGEPHKNQTALSDYLACVWLTPQMDRLFLDSSGSRRRFLDRLVFAFDPLHSGRVRRYENALSQRSKLLKENDNPDPSWLKGLEVTLAETGIAIEAARLDFMQRLQSVCDQTDAETEKFFPKALLSLRGGLADLLMKSPAVEVEAIFASQLEKTRISDSVTGGAATGVHKTDLFVKYAHKNAPADQCSTGEQKALLIGIILAHSRLILADKGMPPLILLDEVAAHLDEKRRDALYERLLAMRSQFWLTGTDRNLFDYLDGKSSQFHIEQSKIHEAPQQNAA